jgi:release factor glutamine methyltransferase
VDTCGRIPRVRVSDMVAEAVQTLAGANIASPRVDAELLAAFVLGVPRGRLAVATDADHIEVARYRELVRRRASRIPLQHLTGTAPFRRLELAVGPGVFVPRPETEQVVQWGVDWVRGREPSEPVRSRSFSGADPSSKLVPRVSDSSAESLGSRNPPAVPALVVDLCAGSGAIACSMATEVARTSVWAVEQDASALKWLHRNAAGLPVTVVAGDATDPAVLSELDGRVDLVLCNPPYVPEIGAAGLPPEVTEFDPHGAVFGGTDGLEVIRPLVARIATLLRPGGAFAMEHDDTHAYVVPTLVDADGRFTDVDLHHDLARRPRFTTATRAGGPD